MKSAVVIGAGHAGCEAALALARSGVRTMLVTLSLNRVAWASCNPAVGGLGKGHIAREVDALGGEMGRATDATGIQFRRLNMSKGPAVRATRVQIDMYRYSARMRQVLETAPGLSLAEDEVVSIATRNGAVHSITLKGRGEVLAACVVVTTGTFLNGTVHIGEERFAAGRLGDSACTAFADWLRSAGFETRRLKTGTPARLKRESIDFAAMRPQAGDAVAPLMSWASSRPALPQVECFETHTNDATHEVIRKNLEKSPVYGGRITGVGPRYCPSIETKVVRFPDRNGHQIFVEPTGLESDLFYPAGISTGFPKDVQEEMLHTIGGLENAVMAVPAYAIEYDAIKATHLLPTMESKTTRGLFFAGQVNGTSGYEEAAGQGILAGINASLRARGEEPVILRRDEAYIGVMADDLTGLSFDEPYRMFTSRAEYRLLLREANSARRLTPLGRRVGLVGDEQWSAFTRRCAAEHRVREALHSVRLKAEASINDFLAKHGSSPLRERATLAEILARPEISLRDLSGFLGDLLMPLDADALEDVETEVKYEGYIRRENALAEKLLRMESRRIPLEMDYGAVGGLTTEAREKLEAIRPATVGQAFRIPGVTPAAVAAILVEMEKK